MARKRRSFSARLLPELARALGFSAPQDPAGALDVAWPVLARAYEAAFGFPLTVSDRLAFERMLRELDDVVAGFDDHGLYDSERPPALARALAPWLGVRFGVAAAWVDAGLAPAALSAVPDLADRLCDPFDDDVFPWALEATLQALRPEWRDREARIRGLAREGVATRRTIKTWFEADTEPSLKAFQRLLARLAPPDHPALVPLRLARALAYLRAPLHGVLVWVGPSSDEAVAIWARAVRDIIRKHGLLHLVLRATADTLQRDPHEIPLFLARKSGRFGTLLAGVPGPDICAALRRIAGGADGDADKATWLAAVTAESLLDPNPVLTLLAGAHLDARPPVTLSAIELARRVGREWAGTAWLKAVAWKRPVEVRVPGEPTPRRHAPSEALRAEARRVSRALCFALESYDYFPVEILFLTIQARLLHEAAGPAAVETLLAESDGSPSGLPVEHYFLVAHFEDLVPLSMMESVPRLALFWSDHLLALGQDDEAWTFFERWRNDEGSRDATVLHKAAETVTRAVHRILDALRDEADGLSHDARSARFAAARRWWMAGEELPDGPHLDQHLANRLVVAIRLDAAEARLQGLATPAYRRAAEAARAVDERLADAPDQPDLVAAHILWRWVRRGPDPRDLRRVVATDAWLPYRSHRNSLRADGLLPA